jgi:hypothetical protein
MAFIYQAMPLSNPRDIRLLDLHPGTMEQPIVITLRKPALEAAAYTFEAVSYTWGGESQCKTVFCGLKFSRLLKSLSIATRHSCI